MQQPNDAFIRTYAIEMLTDVNDQPHINKEKLFIDSIAFYRWRLQEEEETIEESLDFYMHEFRAHHRQVLGRLEKEVWCACFITWFVEQGFHKLPPLTGFNPEDQCMINTRFSSPSFRLPTGEPTETYLVQWVLWHLDNPPRTRTRPDEALLQRWSRDMVDEQMVSDARERALVTEKAIRFFCWCRLSVGTWAKFMEYVMEFIYSDSKRIEAQLNRPDWDICFVNWFTESNLDQVQRSGGDV